MASMNRPLTAHIPQYVDHDDYDEGDTMNEVPPPPSVSASIPLQAQHTNHPLARQSTFDDYDGATMGTDTMAVVGAAEMALAINSLQRGRVVPGGLTVGNYSRATNPRHPQHSSWQQDQQLLNIASSTELEDFVPKYLPSSSAGKRPNMDSYQETAKGELVFEDRRARNQGTTKANNWGSSQPHSLQKSGTVYQHHQNTNPLAQMLFKNGENNSFTQDANNTSTNETSFLFTRERASTLTEQSLPSVGLTLLEQSLESFENICHDGVNNAEMLYYERAKDFSGDDGNGDESFVLESSERGNLLQYLKNVDEYKYQSSKKLTIQEQYNQYQAHLSAESLIEHSGFMNTRQQDQYPHQKDLMFMNEDPTHTCHINGSTYNLGENYLNNLDEGDRQLKNGDCQNEHVRKPADQIGHHETPVQNSRSHQSNERAISEKAKDGELQMIPKQRLRDIYDGEDPSTDVDIPHPRFSPNTEVFLAKSEDRDQRIDRYEGASATCKSALENETAPRSSGKQSFLRKGTRREPSALHKMKSFDSAQVAAKSTKKPTEPDTKTKLAALEKMQRDQIEQLEHRMKRREQAREEILQNQEKKDTIAQVEPKVEPHRSDVDHHQQKEKCSVDQAIEEHSVEDSEFEDGADESLGSSSKESTDDDDNEKENRNHILLQSANSKKPASRYKRGTKKLEIATKAQNGIRPRKCTPQKPKNGRRERADNDDVITPRRDIEEQWQVIKSMRKRQEAALKAAEKEREETRSWAALEKETVQKWADDQRTLVQRDRQRAANAAMASKRQQKQEEVQQKSAETAESRKKKQNAEIDALKATVHKLKIDMDAAKARNRTNEKKLRDRVREQDDDIHRLQDLVESLRKKNMELSKKTIEALESCSSTKKPRSQANDAASKSPLQANTPRSRSQSKKNIENVKKDTMGRFHVADEEKKEEPTEKKKEPTEKKKESIEKKLHDFKDVSFHQQNTDFRFDRKGNQGLQSKSDLLSNHRSGGNEEKPKSIESTNFHHDSDQEAIRVISSYQDLIEEPTEQWLQRHLKQLNTTKPKRASTPVSNDTRPDLVTGMGVHSNEIDSSFGGKQYNPSNYSADIPVHKVEPQQGGVLDNISKLRTEKRCPDGRQIVSYRNGTQKEVFLDGTAVVKFTNGDTKTTYPGKVVVYYYSAAKTSHTTHPDGLEVYEFENGQTEKHFPDGTKEVYFADGTKKAVFSSGGTETVFPDGVCVIEHSDGSKEISRF